MRSVLPNTSRQYEKRDRLIEEPIGSVLRLIYVLLFLLNPNSIFGSSHPLGIKKNLKGRTETPIAPNAGPDTPEHAHQPWPTYVTLYWGPAA